MDRPPKSERRTAPRLAAAHPISVEWQTQEGELHRARGTTRDLARGGIYCFLERPLSPGQPVEFDIIFPAQLAGGNPLKLRCSGRVLRSEKAEGRRFGVAVSIETSEVLETLEPTIDAARERVYIRIVPPSAVVAEYPGMRSVVRELSLAGAFIEDERPLPVGRLFELRLCSDRLQTEISVRAIVRRVEPQVGMAVEFVALSKEAKKSLQELVRRGRPWRSADEAFPSSAWQVAESQQGAVNLDQVKEFIRQRAARALPQLEILSCFYRVGDGLFSLHLRDPFSQAELLLPISERWVQECQLNGDCSRIDRAFKSASKILDLNPEAFDR